jgi:hypothetical protein
MPRMICQDGIWADASDTVCLPLPACGG